MRLRLCCRPVLQLRVALSPPSLDPSRADVHSRETVCVLILLAVVKFDPRSESEVVRFVEVSGVHKDACIIEMKGIEVSNEVHKFENLALKYAAVVQHALERVEYILQSCFKIFGNDVGPGAPKPQRVYDVKVGAGRWLLEQVPSPCLRVSFPHKSSLVVPPPPSRLELIPPCPPSHREIAQSRLVG